MSVAEGLPEIHRNGSVFPREGSENRPILKSSHRNQTTASALTVKKPRGRESNTAARPSANLEEKKAGDNQKTGDLNVDPVVG